MERRTAFVGVALAALATSGTIVRPATASADTSGLGRMGDYIRLATHDDSGQVLHNRWLVQVAGQTVAAGASTGQARQAQDAVVTAAARRGVRLSPDHRYSRTFNGMAVTMTSHQATALASVPGVTGIYPVVEVQQPATSGTRTNDVAADALSGVSTVRDDLGWTGKGIKVGVIDSGIDIDHPDLGGNGTNGSTSSPTKKVAYGYDFVGDAYDSNDPNSVPVPDAVPDDCGGHGTHVAGIIGADGDTAKGGVKGVAPDVTLGAYRVFGCKGSTSSDIVLAALDRAEADGMDVVNLSLGFGYMSWSDYPTALATDALAAKGVVVVTSAGNDGEHGTFSDGAPSTGHRTISVASYDNTQVTSNAFLAGSGQLAVGYGNATGAPIAPLQGSLRLVVAGAVGTPEGQGCTAPAQSYPTGSAVLVQRGTCSFRDKALIAEKAGAAAVVIDNNQAGTVNPTVEGSPALTIPVVMVTQASGTELRTRAAAGDTAFAWSNRTVTTPDAAGGQVSSFSSYGLAADLTLKPDLGAPGGNIWSTYPLEKGGHVSLSGTSMASPHVAGSVALMLQARPKLKGHPDEVLRLLQNTAVHDAPWQLNPKLGLPEPVIRQGAGLIQLDRALNTSQTVSPAKISLGDDQSRRHTTTLTLRNTTRRPVVYTLANQTSIGTLGTSNPSFDDLAATVTMPSKVVVPARGSAKVTVTITSPADAPNGYVYGGWINATTTTGTSLSVPYAGMAGDYQRVSVLTAPGTPAPCLGRLTANADNTVTAKCLEVQTGGGFTMYGNDLPAAVFRVEYPAERLVVDVYKANDDGTKGALLGHIYDGTHEPRADGATGVSWDGSYVAPTAQQTVEKATPGNYLFEVSALRPLGSAGNPDDWERWDSERFTVSFETPKAANTAAHDDPVQAAGSLGGGSLAGAR